MAGSHTHTLCRRLGRPFIVERPPERWYRDPEYVGPALRVLGIRYAPGERFPSIIPGQDKRLAHIDSDFHYIAGMYSLQLAEVYASIQHGHLVRLQAKSSHLGRWTSRLAYQAGLIRLVTPPLYLPPGLRATELEVAKGFALNYSLNEMHHPDADVLFTQEFGMAWTGLSEYRFRKAMAVLRRVDTIRRVDQIQVGRLTMNLFTPGDGSQHRFS